MGTLQVDFETIFRLAWVSFISVRIKKDMVNTLRYHEGMSLIHIHILFIDNYNNIGNWEWSRNTVRDFEDEAQASFVHYI